MSEKIYLKNKVQTPHRWLMAALFSVLVASGAWAQSFTIKGKVTDFNGSGIPGVSVRIENTNLGTNTNGDGDYTFTANTAAGNYKLVFSSIGFANFTQNLTLGAQTSIVANAKLQDATNSLDEVVVVGSTVKTTRRQLGNAISSVSSESLARCSAGSPSAAARATQALAWSSRMSRSIRASAARAA